MRHPHARTAALAAALVLGLAAGAAVAGTGGFPWEGTSTLYAADGKTMTWTLRADGGAVVVEGKSPAWTVSHRAHTDGTPVSTTKTKGGRTATVSYRAGGASYAWKDGAKSGGGEIDAKGLWDGDALEARLAAFPWAAGKVVTFSVIDTDSDDGDVYEMNAKYIGLETCKAGPCHHVKVALAGIKAGFGPKWHFWFGATPGAPYLKFEGRIGTFEAR
jgi:hypothetical protein